MKKYIPYIIILLLAVLLFLSVDKCSHEYSQGISNANALTDTITHFTNRLGTQTASIAMLEFDNRQLKNVVLSKDRQLQALISEFSKVHTVVKYKTQTVLDTVFVAYKQPLDSLPVFERAGTVSDKWYGFNYRTNNNGLIISDFTMQTETTILTGTKRKWFLGKETLIADVINTNPYITVTDIKAAEVTITVPWYKKWYVWLAAGILGGFAAAK